MSTPSRWPARSSRPASASSCASAPLDARLPVAIIPGLLVRAAGKEVPVTRPGAPSDAHGYDLRSEQPGGLWRESEAFLRAGRGRRSLKTQQCDHAETPCPVHFFGGAEP